MIVAAFAGALAALVATAALARLQPAPRRSLPLVSRGSPRSTRASASVDHAAFLDAVARRVRTGTSLTAAILEEVERCPPLRIVADRLQRGSGLADALTGIDSSPPDLALTAQALTATARLGGPVAATLDEAASVVRERAAARAERRAHSAQARLSARVMTVVPLGFAAWNTVTSDTARSVYLTSGVATASAVAGVLLNLAGWRWMKRIVAPP